MVLPFVLIANKKKKQREYEESLRRKSIADERFRVVKTKLLDSCHTATSTSRLNTDSALGRGILGGAAFGTVGAILGVASAEQEVTIHERHTTTFMVWYKDGLRTHRTVDNGSDLYNIYMDKLDV